MVTDKYRLIVIGLGLYLIAGLYNGLPMLFTILLSLAGAWFVYKGFKEE